MMKKTNDNTHLMDFTLYLDVLCKNIYYSCMGFISRFEMEAERNCGRLERNVMKKMKGKKEKIHQYFFFF